MKYIYTTYDQVTGKLTFFDGKKNHDIDKKSLTFIDGYALVIVEGKKDKFGVVLSMVAIINEDYASVIYPLTNVYKVVLFPGGNLLASVIPNNEENAHIISAQLNQEYCRHKSELIVDAKYVGFQLCNSNRLIKIVDISTNPPKYLQLFDYINGNIVDQSRLYDSVDDFCVWKFGLNSEEGKTIFTAAATINIPYEKHGIAKSYQIYIFIDDTGKIIDFIHDDYIGDDTIPPQTEEELLAFITARSELATKCANDAYCIS